MIISASRRTDIPAFYGEWFINRLREGFVLVRNPMNYNQISRIELSSDVVDCIVFWTKNANPFMKYLDEVFDRGYSFYFQYTLNGYDKNIEKYLLPLEDRIKNFIKISDKLKMQVKMQNVIWRYDPILLSDSIGIHFHLKCFENLAQRLFGHTQKCIISFVDFYEKTNRNMEKICAINIPEKLMRSMAEKLVKIALKYNIVIESCCEAIDLGDEGVVHSKCIDDTLISRIIGFPLSLGKYKNPRLGCGCIESVDIGAYNTCRNECVYCYANYSHDAVLNNCENHNIKSPLLIGDAGADEKPHNRKMKSLKIMQTSLKI